MARWRRAAPETGGGGMAVPPTHTLVVRQSNAMVGRLALTRLVTLDCLPLHTTSGNAFSKSPSFGCSVWKLEWGALEEEDQEEARPLSSE